MITKKVRKDERMYGSSRVDPRAFLVLDDCLYDKGWQTDKNIRSVFLNGRHSHCFFLFTSQYSLCAPPMLRNNIDFVFILREPRVSARKRLHENYVGFVPSFDIFNQLMTQCTENYECLVVDNTTKSNKITDQLFWYKADQHPDFHLCDKMFWDMNANCESDDEEEEELYDADAIPMKKNVPNIRVNKVYM